MILARLLRIAFLIAQFSEAQIIEAMQKDPGRRSRHIPLSNAWVQGRDVL